MIEFRNIGKSYGERPALVDISFRVEKGELFGLIGPDGAGKSTLFRILTTVLLPDSGQAFFSGHDVVSDYRYIREHVGYMPGKFSLYQDLSVLENLEFFATVFETTIAENYALIEDIFKQLEPFKSRRAGDLSGGMKQKLALSCALIHRPEVLVLDEPTFGVDAVSRKEFWEMLARLKDQGITILVSTPYMDEAELCDRVALLQQGHILEIDTPDGIIDRFRGSLYKISTDEIHGALKVLARIPGMEQAFSFGREIHLYTDDELDVSHLESTLLSEGIHKASVNPGTPSIEDCFMSLMVQNRANTNVLE